MSEAAPSVQSEFEGTESVLKGLGWMLIMIGMALAVWSFFFNVAVDVPTSDFGGPDKVANANLMAIRQMILTCGATMFITGCFLAVAAAIAARLRLR